MDNDNKVALEKTHEGVQLFLADVLKPLEKSPDSSYDLTTEYAKTKKNHNRSVWLLLAACFGVVALATVAVTAYVSHSNNKITININTFDDLNLKGLLSSVGRTQSMYENARRHKASLETALEAELKQAENNRENALFTLESVASVTSKSAYEKRRSLIQKSYEDEVDRIHQFYDGEIQTAEKEMAQHQSQLDSYDSGRLSQAKENEAALDSQKQLHDLEMTSLTNRYEKMLADLRKKMDDQQKEAVRSQREAVENVRAQYQARIDLLDPLVKDKTGNAYVASALSEENSSYSSDDYSYGLNQDSAAEYLNTLKSVEGNFAEFDYLYKIVRAIPQENNIPQYVDSMQRLTADIGQKMTSQAYTLQKKVENLNSQIDLQKSYYDSYISEYQADALILDATYKTTFPIYLSKEKESLFQNLQSLNAQVFEGKRVITDVVIQKQENGYFAVPADPKTAANVHTFQLLRILLPQEKK